MPSQRTSPLPKRVHLLSGYGLLVTLGKDNNALVLRTFDLDALLEKSGADYLVVTSDPPAVATRGALRNASDPLMRFRISDNASPARTGFRISQIAI